MPFFRTRIAQSVPATSTYSPGSTLSGHHHTPRWTRISLSCAQTCTSTSTFSRLRPHSASYSAEEVRWALACQSVSNLNVFNFFSIFLNFLGRTLVLRKLVLRSQYIRHSCRLYYNIVLALCLVRHRRGPSLVRRLTHVPQGMVVCVVPAFHRLATH